MNKLSLSARGIRNAQSISKANLWVCLGNENQTGDKLRLTIEWLNVRFSHVVVEIADTLNRHNLMIGGTPECDAVRQCVADGDRWLAQSASLLRQFSIGHTIVRWSDILQQPGLNEAVNGLRNLYSADEGFRAAVDADILDYHSRIGVRVDLRRAQASQDYIFEETAADIMAAREGKLAIVYAGKKLRTMGYLQRLGNVEITGNMANIHFIRLIFHANDNKVHA